MKKIRQIISQVKETFYDPGSKAYNDLLWQLICYSPKMMVRLQQELLLNEAQKFTLIVKDEYFAHHGLRFNGFKWGNGQHKVLVTHGWGSKAADFNELITALKEIDDLQVIAFDAPGNGSSEGELSNLLLYVLAVKAVISEFGAPDVIIGHSLGAMANTMALKQLSLTPKLLVSITPLVRLKENFEASMNGAGVPREAQDAFLRNFNDLFEVPASSFNLNEQYGGMDQNHLIIYDHDDLISPYAYLKEFLDANPLVKSQRMDGVGHERMIRSPELINKLCEMIDTLIL